MAGSYDIVQDFGVDVLDPSDPSNTEIDELSVSPDWCLAVIRFATPLTYDRGFQTSFSTLFEDSVKTRGKPLIIRDECVNVQVSNSKASHLTQLSATLLPSRNFLAEVLPGDWIFCWMANDGDTIDTVIRKVQSTEAANNFHDGLKFMGRVNTVHKTINQSPAGPKVSRYSVSATGFTEFDATLFYEPHLAENIPAIGQYFAKLGADLNRLIDKNGEGISVNRALVLFLDLLLGQGVPQNLGLPSIDPALRSTAGLDAPYSYVLPKEVGLLIGKTDKSKPDLLSAADCLEFVYGRQEYEEMETSSDLMALIVSDEGKAGAADVLAGQLFTPKGTRGGGSRRFTGNDMLGTFLPTPPQFSDRSVWSILNQYLNPAVNEMYTCLRVNPFGKVVPTLVARQIPFSTEQAPGDPAVTKFLSLPRWRVHPILVKKADIGRSDSMRINFVHVYGESGPQTMDPVAGQIVLAPPYRDDLDIARSGLRPYMMTVSNNPSDNVDGQAAKQWMAILSDILMGQQLTLTGLLEMHGVQTPICPGDNLEWDGAVFHIESVTHVCQIDPGGHKSFLTTVALSHGLSAKPGNTDLSLFAGVDPEDFTAHDPGLTVEAQDYNSGTQKALNADRLASGHDLGVEGASDLLKGLS
jgi:hypothetical protein